MTCLYKHYETCYLVRGFPSWGDEHIFGWWEGDSPYPPSRENPVLLELKFMDSFFLNHKHLLVI